MVSRTQKMKKYQEENISTLFLKYLLIKIKFVFNIWKIQLRFLEKHLKRVLVGFLILGVPIFGVVAISIAIENFTWILPFIALGLLSFVTLIFCYLIGSIVMDQF